MHQSKVNIQPGISVLSVLKHLNYKPWYAVAEFVDNSIQSFIDNNANIDDKKLDVRIDIDASPPGRISIRDNAAGISIADFPRAFRPAALPPDRSGLSEFGMGMKSAACWFAPRWSVRTSVMGDPLSREVFFDIEKIVHDEIEELTIQERPENPDHHFTEIVLEDVFRVPVKKTISKLKQHLADIYRVHIRNKSLNLYINGERLDYATPEILNAPYFNKEDGPNIKWVKDINFDFGDGLSVRGFVAIRAKGNTSKAGLALFRRGRVIQGSGDEGYRPPEIFGSSNSYRYQRLFGELHLSGFEVSHTKDGFRWDENEQPFLQILKEHLDSPEMPLLRQAEGHRARAPKDKLNLISKAATDRTSKALEDRLPNTFPAISETPSDENITNPLDGEHNIATRFFELEFNQKNWRIEITISDDPSESQWLVLSDSGKNSEDPRRIHICVSINHPFMVRFAQSDSEDLEAVLRIAASLAMAEVTARDSGVRSAGTIRRNVNKILKEVFSKA